MAAHPWVQGLRAVWRWYLVSALLGGLWLCLFPALWVFLRWALGGGGVAHGQH